MTDADWGEMKADIRNLRERLNTQDKVMADEFKEVNIKIGLLLDKFAQANGGWKALTILTTIAVGLGALLSKFISVKWGI